ncbi:MAG: cation diffusion facilitator family transporter [Polyangiaceae bacterium]
MAHAHGHGHGAEHGHGHGHAHEHASAPARALKIALALTAGFMLVEAFGGYVSGSLALLADAGHMLADAGALALALAAQSWASKPRTERSTFGYRRAEVLAAFVNGIALALTSVWVIKEAIERWLAPAEIRAEVMLSIAAVGLLVNLVVALVLLRAQRDSLNVRAAFAHVATDAVGSVAALIAGTLVVAFGMQRADPALSVLIACLVAYSGWRVLRETTSILLEATPSHLDVPALEAAIRACQGVSNLHDLHVWRISDRFDALTVHVTLERGAHGVEVCRAVAEKLKAEFDLSHVTIQPEAPPPDAVVTVRASRHGAPIVRAG